MNKILPKLKHTIITICCFSFLISVLTLYSHALTEDQNLADIIKKNNAQGTIVIVSENGDVTYVYNQNRANLRLSPASTFKIPNSIIALEQDILKDQYQIIKWDGKKRFLDAWNKDQNLKSAFKSSCVWFYQELAKKIGNEKYLQHLKKLDYGNHLTGKEVTTFWLGGEGDDLKITPVEQIKFLRKIYKRKLSIDTKTYDILKDIMLEETTPDYKIYSKTGAMVKDFKNWKGHGWYVGYIETKQKTWFFATNILMNDVKDLPKRKTITLQALKEKGII